MKTANAPPLPPAQPPPEPLWEEMRTALQAIRAQSLRVRSITRRLLAFGKGMDSGAAPLDMPHIVGKAMSMLAGQAEVCRVSIHVTLDPTLPRPHGSTVEVQQACVHVLENALEALSEGGTIHIHATLRPGNDAEDPAYLLHMADSGPGIPPETLPHIFEPFFSTKPKGAGLGLAVCKSLLRRQGGDIIPACATSPLGGACMTMVLPLPTGQNST